ncbi:MAG: hypothetical protein ABSD49_10500 [Candidatus Bathyarchaeia archaeon]
MDSYSWTKKHEATTEAHNKYASYRWTRKGEMKELQYIKNFRIEIELTTNKGTNHQFFNVNAPKYGNTVDGRDRLLFDLQQLVQRMMNVGIMEALPIDQSKTETLLTRNPRINRQ